MCTDGHGVGLPRGWDGFPQAYTCVLCASNKAVLWGHVFSRLASCCKATGYIYINQRAQLNSFRHGGRHSAHAETFPRAAISGRCWMLLQVGRQICVGQANARVSPGRARARRDR